MWRTIRWYLRPHISPVCTICNNLSYMQLAFPAVTVCNKNRINCRELNKFKKLKKCESKKIDIDTLDYACNKTASDECDEICSLIEIACQDVKEALITPCSELYDSSGGSGAGSGSGKCYC